MNNFEIDDEVLVVDKVVAALLVEIEKELTIGALPAIANRVMAAIVVDETFI